MIDVPGADNVLGSQEVGLEPGTDVLLLLPNNTTFQVSDADRLFVHSVNGTIESFYVFTEPMSQEKAVETYLDLSNQASLEIGDIEKWNRTRSRDGGRRNLLAIRDMYPEYLSLSVEIIPTATFHENNHWSVSVHAYWIPEWQRDWWEEQQEYFERKNQDANSTPTDSSQQVAP